MINWLRSMRYMLEMYMMHILIMYYFNKIETHSMTKIADDITRTGTILQDEMDILLGHDKDKNVAFYKEQEEENEQ